MRVVWKYTIGIGGASVMMPKGAEIIHVDMHGDTIRLWALVDPSKPERQRVFTVHGTGHENISLGESHIGSVLQRWGTFVLRTLVWHVFEVGA